MSAAEVLLPKRVGLTAVLKNEVPTSRKRVELTALVTLKIKPPLAC